MKYTAILWKHSSTDGPYPLKLRIRSGTAPAKYFPFGLPVGIYLMPEEWDGDRWRVSESVVNHKAINLELINVKNELEKRMIANGDLTYDEIRELLRMDSGRSNIVNYYEKYAQDCENGLVLHRKKKTRLSASYIKSIRTNVKYLKGFNDKKEKVTWGKVNEAMLNRFVTFMRDWPLDESTIAKSIKILKTIMSAARREGLHNNDAYRDYSVKFPPSFKLKLTEDEMGRMLNVDLSDRPELKDEQDRLKVAYNFLLRFSDSITIKPEEIKVIDGKRYLKKVHLKTGKEVLIPFRSGVYEILKKRNFKFSTANSKSNKKLKAIGLRAKVSDEIYYKGELRKKWELIETHTARRSMATHLYNSGMDVEIIMAMGGWTNREQMMAYIDVDLEVKAKQAATHRLFQ